MKRVDVNSTQRFENAVTCRGIEYNFGPEADMNGALITVSGRYPEAGFVMNEVCSELAYVTRGSGKVCKADETIEFAIGDTLCIQPGEKYYWDGDFDIYTVCNPAFYPEQHKEIS